MIVQPIFHVSDVSLQDQLDRCLNMPVSYETVVARTQLAVVSALEIMISFLPQVMSFVCLKYASFCKFCVDTYMVIYGQYFGSSCLTVSLTYECNLLLLFYSNFRMWPIVI